jgi:protein subunit release factor B
VRSIRQRYRTQRQNIVNFIRTNNIYPQYEGIYLDIRHSEGPKLSEVFINFLRSVYESYAFEQGWQIEEISSQPSHLRLLIHSSQALSHLIGEIGTHSWNTTQGELGHGSGLYRRAGGDNEKRRMIRLQVELSPFSFFQYNMSLSDVQIEQFNSTRGNGGQKRNKTSSDVRATHTPSGITVEVTESRTLQENRRVALDRLKEQVYSHYQQAHDNTLRNSFLQVQYIETNRAARTFHIKENRITGLDSIRLPLRAGISRLDNLTPQEIYPSLRSNANRHFDSAGNQALENMLSHILAIEREISEDTDSIPFQELFLEIEDLAQLGASFQ